MLPFVGSVHVWKSDSKEKEPQAPEAAEGPRQPVRPPAAQGRVARCSALVLSRRRALGRDWILEASRGSALTRIPQRPFSAPVAPSEAEGFQRTVCRGHGGQQTACVWLLSACASFLSRRRLGLSGLVEPPEGRRASLPWCSRLLWEMPPLWTLVF